MSKTPELKRIANAIYQRRKPKLEYWECEDELIEEASAALLAIREPTERMAEAAYNGCALDDRWHIEDGQHWGKAFRAAIDAALGEDKG